MTTVGLNENFNLINTCRLCLNQNKKLISIFDISNCGINYLRMIGECTGVTIFENDDLPKKLCLECVKCLNNFYYFRQTVINSDRRLHDFLYKLWNNLSMNVKTENINFIEEEMDSKNTSNMSISSIIKRDEDHYSLLENSEIENKFQIIEEQLEIVKHELPAVKIEEAQDSEIENKIEIGKKNLKNSRNEAFTKSASMLSNYRENVKEESIFNLKSCSQTFTKETDMNINHEKKNTHNCTFSSQPEILQKLNKSEKSYICNQCGKSFSQSFNLRRHEKFHRGEKPYICQQCNKAFSLKSHLKDHERTHSGERPYTCKQCGNSYAQLGGLRRHEKGHKGEKPYNCTECGKFFTQLSSLKTHKRIHNGERLYNCKQCGNSFTELSNLKKHKQLHTGEKPFRCDLCGKSFIRLFDLKKHKRVHTGEKPYRCEQCGKSFTQSSHLRQHEQIHKSKYVYDVTNSFLKHL